MGQTRLFLYFSVCCVRTTELQFVAQKFCVQPNGVHTRFPEVLVIPRPHPRTPGCRGQLEWETPFCHSQESSAFCCFMDSSDDEFNSFSVYSLNIYYATGTVPNMVYVIETKIDVALASWSL